MVTYSSGAKYTLYMNLGNYIPAQGTLKIKIPSEIQIVSEPWPVFQSSKTELKKGTHDRNSITFLAN